MNNPKRKQILITAKELFWKFGTKRVTVEEICKEANVSKMTFYKFFSNKNELLHTIVEEMFDKILYDYKELMNKDIPFKEKVQQQLIMKFEGTNQLSSELVKDIYSATAALSFSSD